jgi:hypothetical protein
MRIDGTRSDAVPFRPFPLLGGRHAQTLIAATVWWPVGPPSETQLVELADGDRIALEVSTPSSWRPDGATVVLVHGLCGCHRSPYLVRMARRLHRRGLRAVRMNLRGCGTGRGLARQLYHSGRSDDVLAVLESLRRETPRSPTSLVGFSLGGNLALKLAGELADAAPQLLERVIAVCPPADLAACSRRLALPENRFYDRRFVALLRADVEERRRLFPDLPPIELPPRLTLFEFDDLYTAPRCGFAGALDYYTRASSAPLVPRIAVPCTVLFAGDDPVIDPDVLDGLPLPENVRVVRAARGGHLGFLGAPWNDGGWRWLDARLLEWLEA